MSEKYVQVIQAVYGAFGQGDIATILAHVSDGTEWRFNVSHSDVPWHTPIQGKENLPLFFKALADNVTFEAFEPRDFIHSGDHVVVPVHLRYTVRKTDSVVEEDALFWWTFDTSGKITRLIHFEDTAQVLAAYHHDGVSATMAAAT